MIFLVLSIATSTLISLLFKWFKGKELNMLQVLIGNYITCVLCGVAYEAIYHNFTVAPSNDWIWLGALLGIIFITGFYAIAKTVQQFGVTIATVSTKMSVAISVVGAFIFFNETATALKITGVVLALFAVYLSAKTTSSKNSTNETLVVKGSIWLPIFVFLSSGLIEISLKHAQLNLLGANDINLFTTLIFLSAGVLGLGLLIVNLFRKKTTISGKSIGWGLLLGIPNYASIFFLLTLLDQPGWESSMVYPVNNIGIILLSALLAMFLFAEKMNKYNVVGFVLGIIAILLLSAEGFWLKYFL